MATAKRLPSGNWRVKVYVGKVDGKDCYKSVTAPTKRQAEMDAALHLHRQAEPIKLGEAIDRYIEAKQHVLSPSTVVLYRKMRRLCYESIIDIRLDRLTDENIQKAISLYAAGHSSKSTRNASGLLSATLKMFLPSFRYAVTLPQRKKAQISIPTSTDIMRMTKEVEGTRLETALMLAAAMGLRRSEVYAITWDDINLKKKKLTVSKAMVLDDDRTWVLKYTKSTAGHRVLTIPDALVAHLQTLPQEGSTVVGFHPDGFTKRFIRLRKKLGVDCRLHDLRHYYASLMLALGVPDKYAIQRMGHETENMLKTVYQHLLEDKGQDVDQAINEKLNSILAP